MGDVGDDFRAKRDADKERKKRNIEAAKPEGWTQHTIYHWSRVLNGKRLDYWPSKNKFMYDGRVMTGDVIGFIKNRETKTITLML